MLAERKKKVKWTLNPRGNSWSKDTNKFGQRMLEKMGWKSGEGLGVNKQGITEHVKVAYKNDNKCLGYKDNGEEWVEHQSQFESLLAELSSSHSTIATVDSGKDKISQIETLEQRSRHSRTRVHYQKFTRGKDLSKYSEKDLKCILLNKQKANSGNEENEDNDGSNDHFNGFYGIKTINKGCMSDYFKKFTNSQNYSGTSHLDVHFEEIGESEKCNDVREQCDMKVKKQKRRKAEMQVSDTEHSNTDSNDTSSIKQLKKRKPCKVFKHLDNINDDCSYTDYENITFSNKGLQRYNITVPKGTSINGICNEKLHCDEICKDKKLKKWKNWSIQDRESEIMEVKNEIDDKQVKKKSQKKNSELINEDTEISFVPTEDLSSKSKNSEVAECLTHEAEVRQAKKASRKKHPMLPSEENTLLVPVECVSHDSKIAENTELHLIAELHEAKCKQKQKKCKKKKQDFTGDEEISVMPVEDVSHGLENSKEVHHLLIEIKGKQLKKKSKKKKKHGFLSESREISVLPAEDVTYTLENMKDTEQYLAIEVADEIEGKQLNQKIKTRKNEDGETSVVPVKDVARMFENSENSDGYLMHKDEGRLSKGTNDIHISPENNLKAADVNRLNHVASNDNEDKSNEETAEDVVPIKKKKKINAKMSDVENSVANDISEYESISAKKRKYKRKQDENEVDGQSEQTEHVMKEDKRASVEEELNVANSIHGTTQSIVNEKIAKQLNIGCLESPAKLHKKYSVDEIKNMKLSLFAQLIDPNLVEFKGSNLRTIAGYGKW